MAFANFICTCPSPCKVRFVQMLCNILEEIPWHWNSEGKNPLTDSINERLRLLFSNASLPSLWCFPRFQSLFVTYDKQNQQDAWWKIWLLGFPLCMYGMKKITICNTIATLVCENDQSWAHFWNCPFEIFYSISTMNV